MRQIIEAHLKQADLGELDEMINKFLKRRDQRLLATDQLLNAMFLISQGRAPKGDERARVLDIIYKELGRA